MQEEFATGNEASLARAKTTIAHQAEEIARLRRRLDDERLAEELHDALSLAATAGTIAAPVTHSRLLEMIVETAAHVIRARAGSLFLVDEETEELIFEVALGQKAEEVKKFRVPLGHGIAGLVAVSGQPMAVSEAQQDPRQASDIAQSIGYMPQSILCVPLFYGDRVIGVLELLDKESESSFSTADIEALGLFANQAAVAIEQSRTHRNLTALIAEVLASAGGAASHQGREVRERIRAFAAGLEEDATYRQALEMGRLVQEIAHQGENEAKVCQAILRSFAEYLRLRPQPLTDLESWR